MSWKKQRRLQGKNRYYSLSKKLRRENRSNDEFEVMLSQISLEELISKVIIHIFLVYCN